MSQKVASAAITEICAEKDAAANDQLLLFRIFAAV